ncbi:MAG: peptidylprolyl isomerase [Armatimonadetes bacterium]|nr:peptidylprolyl isomerase [Armatimonadota bacterium]MDE2206448.1 peptidylprolyl isomerase [Armatimonadota bacterium]
MIIHARATLYLPLVALFACTTLLPASAAPPLRGSDVLATVDGFHITRRAVARNWVQIDPKALDVLGRVLQDRWMAGRPGSAAVVPSAALYSALFASSSQWKSVLKGMIDSRVVADAAALAHIQVTHAEMQQRAHELLNTVRQQQGITASDVELVRRNHIPMPLFLQDMAYRIRCERLLKQSIAAHNGHAISVDDWVEVRLLFAAIPSTSTPAERAAQTAAAHDRIARWLSEVTQGRAMADVARDHNEDTTRSEAGLNGPWLRGTGDPVLEKVVFALKPGQTSGIVQAANGFYVFRCEKRGATVSLDDRNIGWQQVLKNRLPAFVAGLRLKAHVTSVVPLPAQ